MAEGNWQRNDRDAADLITVRDLTEIHRRIIDAGPECEASLRDAVRDEATLDFIVMGANGISDPLERAAFLLHRIATQHPFFEGNKRTALSAAAGTLIVYAKKHMRGSPEKINEFIRKAASGNAEEREIVLWLKAVTEDIIR